MTVSYIVLAVQVAVSTHLCHVAQAQFAGSFCGAALVYTLYFDAINHFDGGHRSVTGDNATAGLFAT